MNHAVSAAVMMVMALLFTSCTANLVQQWAMARQPQSEFVPPVDPREERRQAVLPAKSSDDCKTSKPGDPPRPPMLPRFSPVRQSTPKT